MPSRTGSKLNESKRSRASPFEIERSRARNQGSPSQLAMVSLWDRRVSAWDRRVPTLDCEGLAMGSKGLRLGSKGLHFGVQASPDVFHGSADGARGCRVPPSSSEPIPSHPGARPFDGEPVILQKKRLTHAFPGGHPWTSEWRPSSSERRPFDPRRRPFHFGSDTLGLRPEILRSPRGTVAVHCVKRGTAIAERRPCLRFSRTPSGLS